MEGVPLPLGRFSKGLLTLVTLTLLVGVWFGTAGAQAPRSLTSEVMSIDQSPVVTEQSTFTVSMQVSDPSVIHQVWFTFCQLDPPNVCFNPIVMTQNSSNWFTGSTNAMSSYSGMTPGVRAGYNITITFANGTSRTEPDLNQTFPGLTVVPSVSGQYEFEMVVTALTYALSGTVSDSTTGQAISGASVSLTPGNFTPATTDSSGKYSFPDVPNGTYTLSVVANGYPSTSASVTIGGQAMVKDFSLSNSSQPGGGQTGTTGKSSSLGFFGTSMGIGILAGTAIVLVIGVTAALTLSRKRTLNRPGDATRDSPDPPSPSPVQKSN